MARKKGIAPAEEFVGVLLPQDLAAELDSFGKGRKLTRSQAIVELVKRALPEALKKDRRAWAVEDRREVERHRFEQQLANGSQPTEDGSELATAAKRMTSCTLAPARRKTPKPKSPRIELNFDGIAQIPDHVHRRLSDSYGGQPTDDEELEAARFIDVAKGQLRARMLSEMSGIAADKITEVLAQGDS